MGVPRGLCVLLSHEHGLWHSSGPVCQHVAVIWKWSYRTISKPPGEQNCWNTGSEYERDLETYDSSLTARILGFWELYMFRVPVPPPEPFQQQDEESCAIWIASSSCPYLKTALILNSEIIVLKVKILNIEILETEFQKWFPWRKATREGQILWKDWLCKAAGSKIQYLKPKKICLQWCISKLMTFSSFSGSQAAFVWRSQQLLACWK